MKFSNTLPVVFILQGRNRLYLLSSNRPSSTSKQSFWYVVILVSFKANSGSRIGMKLQFHIQKSSAFQTQF